MDPRHLFMDERLRGMCAYCGAGPDTRDHVPSKVLLDDPLPSQLPVVDACGNCNNSHSRDEQYLACFLECVVSGTTDPLGVRRAKVARILTENPTLRGRIAASRRKGERGNAVWVPEADRVRRVARKLALGHVAHELYPRHDEPTAVLCAPLPELSEQARAAFEDAPLGVDNVFPEIGTRAFIRTCLLTATDHAPTLLRERWIVVQPDRYRYVVETDGSMVRMVLSEYLACEVVWG